MAEIEPAPVERGTVGETPLACLASTQLDQPGHRLAQGLAAACDDGVDVGSGRRGGIEVVEIGLEGLIALQLGGVLGRRAHVADAHHLEPRRPIVPSLLKLRMAHAEAASGRPARLTGVKHQDNVGLAHLLERFLPRGLQIALRLIRRIVGDPHLEKPLAAEAFRFEFALQPRADDGHRNP